VRQWQQLACAGIIVALCAARFVRLNDTPAGFYLDEAAGAANILCIAESGISEQGQRLPLFFPEVPGTGTFFTPAYVYSGALWTKLFGTSIAALRAHIAFYSVLTILAVFAVARRFIGMDGALLATLAAAVSPWGFQFARIAWDPPLAPCFVLWGIYFFLRRSVLSSAISGLLWAAAMYTYAPARVHVPLLLVLLWIIERPRRSHALTQLAALAMAIVPLVASWGTLHARANDLGIWNDAHPVRMFFANFFSHLSVDFLVVHGDANLRHGTQMFGILSWVDLLALAVGLAAWRFGSRKLLLLSAGGWLSAFAVTSLSWEGIPHALRSIVGWPFLALLSGTLLAAACARWRIVPWLVLTCAVVFSTVFLSTYFTTYRKASAVAFDAVIRETAEHGDWRSLRTFDYPSAALHYYSMHYGGASCDDVTTPSAAETNAHRGP
jgi:hypothetical protein